MVLVICASEQCELVVLFQERRDSVVLPSANVSRVSPSTVAAQLLHKLLATALSDAQLLDLGIKAECGGFASILGQDKSLQLPKGYVWLKLAEVTARANEKDKSWVDTAYK